MEHGWRPESSVQSSRATKDASGTYAVCSTPPRDWSSGLGEEAKLKRIWNKELLRNRNCFGRVKMLYQYKKRLRINGQNSILFICKTPSLGRQSGGRLHEALKGTGFSEKPSFSQLRTGDKPDLSPSHHTPVCIGSESPAVTGRNNFGSI